MVTVLHTYRNEEIPREPWLRMLQALPGSLRTTIARSRRWQDRQASLLGKLLLKKWLMQNGYGRDCLDLLTCNEYGRPRIHENIDFNISHSGGYVICAISDEGKVGVDIEKIEPIEIDDFKESMPPAQWAAISGSKHPRTAFFAYWTKCESVAKADGRGLSIPIRDIHLNHHMALLNDRVWFLREMPIGSDYICHIAVNKEISELVVREAQIVDLPEPFATCCVR